MEPLRNPKRFEWSFVFRFSLETSCSSNPWCRDSGKRSCCKWVWGIERKKASQIYDSTEKCLAIFSMSPKAPHVEWVFFSLGARFSFSRRQWLENSEISTPRVEGNSTRSQGYLEIQIRHEQLFLFQRGCCFPAAPKFGHEIKKRYVLRF